MPDVVIVFLLQQHLYGHGTAAAGMEGVSREARDERRRNGRGPAAERSGPGEDSHRLVGRRGGWTLDQRFKAGGGRSRACAMGGGGGSWSGGGGNNGAKRAIRGGGERGRSTSTAGRRWGWRRRRRRHADAKRLGTGRGRHGVERRVWKGDTYGEEEACAGHDGTERERGGGTCMFGGAASRAWHLLYGTYAQLCSSTLVVVTCGWSTHTPHIASAPKNEYVFVNFSVNVSP